jgi:hypothetical protein
MGPPHSRSRLTRRMNMKRSFRWSASPIASVVVVAGFLATACSAGQGVASATPASASLAAGPSTSAPPTPSFVDMSDGSLEAGTTYFINDSRVDGPRWVVLTVPASGWVSNDWIVRKTLPGTSDPAIAKLSTWTIGNLKADPCRWKAGTLDPPVGPTVGDLAAALIEQVRPAAATSTDVTLDGYRGKKVEYSAPSDFDHSSCDEGVYSRWEAASEPGDWGGWVEAGGQRNAVYIIDVEGQRLVIDAMSLPVASAADVAELDQIIASIRFEPRASSPSPSP